LLADDTQVFESQLSPFGTLEIYSRNMTSQINDLRSMWRDGYSAINRANNVIQVIREQRLNDHPDYDATTFAIYEATALFARAAIHFEMVRFWGQPYDVEAQGGNTQLGIPYRTEPTLSGPDGLEKARNTVEEVYENVVADFQAALVLLEPLGNGSALYANWYRHKIDKWAVKAYLSRVYFFMGRNQEASTLAEEVIGSGLFTLDAVPRANFTQATTTNTTEQIFQLISFAEDRTGNPAWGYTRFGSPLFGPDSNAKWLFHPGDVRLNNFSGYFYGNFFGDTTIAKYDKPNAVNGINMCVLRLAECFLTAAEANLSSGGNGDAVRSATLYGELYQLRTGNPAYIPSTNDSLLELIRLERRLELMFEGDRYHNLRRMKQPVRGGVPHNDASLLFKIPQEEMSGNSLMVQNP